MKLKVVDGKLKLSSAYKLIAVGWFIGFTTVFLSLAVLIFITSILGGTPQIDGHSVSAGEAALYFAPMLLIFPIAIGLHAIIFGGIITFGLWLYRRKRPIEIVQIEEL